MDPGGGDMEILCSLAEWRNRCDAPGLQTNQKTQPLSRFKPGVLYVQVWEYIYILYARYTFAWFCVDFYLIDITMCLSSFNIPLLKKEKSLTKENLMSSSGFFQIFPDSILDTNLPNPSGASTRRNYSIHCQEIGFRLLERFWQIENLGCSIQGWFRSWGRRLWWDNGWEMVAGSIVINWVVVSNILYFHPYLGKIPNLTNIFQRGWNHQLVNMPCSTQITVHSCLSSILVWGLFQSRRSVDEIYQQLRLK